MTEERLIIGGKSFISSIRAAQLFGYTKDYVGQLARAGKIESQLIGRSWYVDEDSIRKHKLSVHYTLTKPKKTRKQVSGLGGVSRDDMHEKAIENIDLSDEEQIPVHAKYEYISQKKYSDLDAHAQQDDTQDLFPRPVKNRANDALVKSDFRFESDPPLSYTHDIVPIRGDFETNTDMRDVYIHKESKNSSRLIRTEKHRNRAIFENRDKEMSEFVAMDGILVPGNISQKNKKTFQTSDTENETSDFDTEKFDANANSDEDEHEETYPQEDRPSRLLPIIGAIIIFLVLTILYLVI